VEYFRETSRPRLARVAIQISPPAIPPSPEHFSESKTPSMRERFPPKIHSGPAFWPVRTTPRTPASHRGSHRLVKPLQSTVAIFWATFRKPNPHRPPIHHKCRAPREIGRSTTATTSTQKRKGR